MLVLLLLLFVDLTIGCSDEERLPSQNNGGWTTDEKDVVGACGLCNIERHDANTLTQEEFVKRYAYSEPVIFTHFDNSQFQKLCDKQRMLDRYGELPITLTSADTYSSKKVPTNLRNYIDAYLSAQNREKLGNETLFLFGDIDREAWSDLLKEYIRPPWKVPGLKGELSFGIAGAGTGVPFHFHGPVYAEVVYGRKKWFLYPPDEKPDFHPDETTLFWFLNKYPKLERSAMPFECVLGPGEVLYFPDRWWHATLNVETAVFMSTFLSA